MTAELILLLSLAPHAQHLQHHTLLACVLFAIAQLHKPCSLACVQMQSPPCTHTHPHTLCRSTWYCLPPEYPGWCL